MTCSLGKNKARMSDQYNVINRQLRQCWCNAISSSLNRLESREVLRHQCANSSHSQHNAGIAVCALELTVIGSAPPPPLACPTRLWEHSQSLSARPKDFKIYLAPSPHTDKMSTVIRHSHPARGYSHIAIIVRPALPLGCRSISCRNCRSTVTL